MKLQMEDMMILDMIKKGCSNELIQGQLGVTNARVKLIRHKYERGDINEENRV